MATQVITNPYGDPINDGRVSRCEVVSAMITALVILLGITSSLMVAIWFGNFDWNKPLQNVVEVLALAVGEQEPLGEAKEVAEPGEKEFPEIETPQLVDSIEALTDVASTIAASDREIDGLADKTKRGNGPSSKVGSGPSGASDVLETWERWSIRYTTASKEAYAQQLDSFKIEIAAISRTTPEIQYLSGMSETLRHRLGKRSADQRVFFIYDQGVLRQWDMEFMQQAKVDMKNKLLVQFYPDEVQARLLELEREKLGARRLKAVYRTIFGVRQSGSGHEFYVIDQIYR